MISSLYYKEISKTKPLTSEEEANLASASAMMTPGVEPIDPPTCASWFPYAAITRRDAFERSDQ